MTYKTWFTSLLRFESKVIKEPQTVIYISIRPHVRQLFANITLCILDEEARNQGSVIDRKIYIHDSNVKL